MKVSMTAVAITAALCIAGCKSTQIESKEDLLSAAGFQMKPANTPERIASLKALPPNKFVPKTKGDKTAYLYADPVVCNCLYVGDQNAFNAYKKEVYQRNLADEQQLTAQMYTGPYAWGGWDWGRWGWGGRWW